MKVKLIPFQLGFSNNIDIGMYFQEMERRKAKEYKVMGSTAVVYSDVVGDCITGVVLKYKQNKKSLVTEENPEGELIVNKKMLGDGEKGTDAGVFCINPGTLKGIFYSYSGGVSPSFYYTFFKSIHDTVKRQIEKSLRDEITEFGKKNVEKIKERIQQHFLVDYKFELLATPADLDKLLNMYQSIDKIVLRADDALSDAGIFTPFDIYSTKSSIEINVSKNAPIGKIKAVAKNVLKGYSGFRKGKVLRFYGLLHSGEYLDRAIGDNVDYLGVIDFDEYVDLLPDDKWNLFAKSESVGRLLESVNKYTSVFGIIPKSREWKLLSANDYSNGG